MSDLPPTKEQENAAYEFFSRYFGTFLGMDMAEDLALLLAQRDKMHAAVIRLLRALLGEVLLDDHIGAYNASGMLDARHAEIVAALKDTEKYEVNE
jgi:hypothetical protein